MKIDNIPNLKIYKLTKEQYKRMLENGEIEDNAFYFTPGASEDCETIIVEKFDSESGESLATHSSAEIYELVKQGKQVVFNNTGTGSYYAFDTLCALINSHPDYAIFVGHHTSGETEYFKVDKYKWVDSFADDYVSQYEFDEAMAGKLDKPTLTLNDETPHRIYGENNQGRVLKYYASSAPDPYRLACYDREGKLTSNYIYDGEEIPSQVVTQHELWDYTEGYLTAYQIWAYEEDGVISISDNWDDVYFNICEDTMPVVVHISHYNGYDADYEQIWGAVAHAETDETNCYIIFGDKYILRYGSDVLEPYEKPEKKYEPIEKYTFPEAVDMYTRTQEPDGTPYKFKRIYIRTKLTTTEALAKDGSFEAYYNNQKIARNYVNKPNKAGTFIGQHEVWQDAGYWRAKWGDFDTNITNRSLGSGNEYGFFPELSIVDYPYINKISYNAPLPAGTTIEIWGVRA